MSPKNNLQARIAERLAESFNPVRGRRGAPLAFRLLPEGGMVVIAADGRKLWFSVEEVNRAAETLSGNADGPEAKAFQSRFKPTGLVPKEQKPSAYNGMPALIVLPPKNPDTKSEEG